MFEDSDSSRTSDFVDIPQAVDAHKLELELACALSTGSSQDIDLDSDSRSPVFKRGTKRKHFVSLIEPCEFDEKVLTVLQFLIHAILSVIKRLCADFLKDGQWYDKSDELKMKLMGTPKHNKFSESIFGHLDRLLREKPNITMVAAESYIMFCENKTLKWLEQKIEKEREKLVKMARKEEKGFRKKFKDRCENVRRGQMELLKEKLDAAEKKRKEKIALLEKYTNDILIWGLWQTVEEVDREVKRLKSEANKTDQLSALCAQLNFRKHVLNQTVDQSKIYNVTVVENEKRRKLTVDELAANVKVLVQNAFRLGTGNETAVILKKEVQHCFETEKDGVKEKQWYTGYVISQVPGYSDWFNINYDGDIALYTYKLMEDYSKGDLKITL